MRLRSLAIAALLIASLTGAGFALLRSPAPVPIVAELPPAPPPETEEQRIVRTFVRPDGPPKVALQAGHWKADEVPDELENLRNNGARAAGVSEWEVNLGIARKTAKLLEARGVTVDILPTTVPPGYVADAFVAIHADSHSDRTVSGYKVAAPRRDLTGHAQELADDLETSYGDATEIVRDPNVTSNMRGYYAFNWREYAHALNPMTPAAILETGFLTSRTDRKIIVARQDIAAKGVADALVSFLRSRELLPQENENPSQ